MSLPLLVILLPSSSTNILGLVVFAVVTGIAIAQCGEDGKPLLKFFESISIVMMKVVAIIEDNPRIVKFEFVNNR